MRKSGEDTKTLIGTVRRPSGHKQNLLLLEDKKPNSEIVYENV